MTTLRESDFAPSRDWRGRWIWGEGPASEQNLYYYFRKEFDLEAAPGTASLRITADTRYKLYVNGTFVAGGPVLSQPYFQYYDTHEVARLLRAGRNCLAVLVYHIGHFQDARGGLLVEVDADDEPVAQSDDSWRALRAHAWWQDTHYFSMNRVTPYQEVFDSRAEPVGWREPGFSDSQWPQATVIGGRGGPAPPAAGPWSKLVPRDIPDLEETTLLPAAVTYVEECLAVDHRQRPLNLSLGLSTVGKEIQYSVLEAPENLLDADAGVTTVRCSTNHLDHVFDGVHDPCIVLDFGRIITAFAEIDIEGPAGSSVDIGYAERLTDDRFVNSIEGQFATRFMLRSGRQTFRTFSWVGFRYVKLRIRGCYEEAKIHGFRAVNSTFPFEERGSFESGDAALNRIWEISRSTIRLCSNEFLTDTPWREQGQWLGDVSAVTLGGIYACFGDTVLPAKFLRQSAANQMPTGFITNMTNSVSFAWQSIIPDYSLWWVQALWEHYLYTGEEKWVHQYYPTVLKLVYALADYVDEHGLVNNMPYWVFIDWADVDRRGECAAFNAIFYATLEAVGKMAAMKQDEYAGRLVEELRSGLKESFAKRLFDSNRGCFADGNIDGQLSPKVSEHANLLAIQYGLCDDKTAQSIVDSSYVRRDISYTRAEPFFTWQVLKALDRIGRFDLALAIVRERWGWMVERGASSCSEEWGKHGSWRSGQYGTFMRTESHAWSACPAEFLTKTLIGLEILEPGCTRIRLSPKPGAPASFRVTYPTPRGPIVVTKDAQGLRCDVPTGIAVENEA